MRAVRYRPDGRGDAWRAAVTGTALAVLPSAVTPHAVEAVWLRLDGGGIGAILESLTGAFGTSLTAIPPFGLAVAEGDGVRVAVRGEVELVVETADGVESVSGAGVATWTERFLPRATRVTVDLGAQGDADTLPIASGVVAVAGVVFDLADRGAATPGGGMPAVAAEPEPVAVPVHRAPGAPVAVAAEAEDAASADDALGDTIASPRSAGGAGASAPSGGTSAPSAGTGAPSGGTSAPSAGTGAPSAGTSAPSAGQVPPLSSFGGSQVSVPAPAGAGDASAETVGGFDDDALGETIASPRRPKTPPVPPVPSLPPFVPPMPPTPQQLGDHDGATISVAEARAMRAAAGTALAGPLPQAGEPAAEYEPIEDVPQRSPSRGRIRLADGRTVELERTVIVGRRPRSTRPSESELPTLVAVDGPQHDISRNHVEIRSEGEHVLAVDLASTNGTVLLRGGHDPVRLHPHEPTMVVDADVLDLGDGVTLTFEDLP